MGWYRCALEAVRQTGEHTRRQGQIKEMGGGLFPASPYGLVSWAKVNRRWDPSFQPVGIELPVAEHESQAYGLVFEVSNVAFGPLHRLTQQIAGQRLGLCDDLGLTIQHLDAKLTLDGIDVDQEIGAAQLEGLSLNCTGLLAGVQRDEPVSPQYGQADSALIREVVVIARLDA